MRRAKLPTADQSYREFKQKERQLDDFLYPRGKPPPAPTLPAAVVRTVAVFKKLFPRMASRQRECRGRRS
jgi:hypothetical protein